MKMKYEIETPKILQKKCDEIWDDVCRTWDDTESHRFEKEEFTEILEVMDAIRAFVDEAVEKTNDTNSRIENLKGELEKELDDVRRNGRI